MDYSLSTGGTIWTDGRSSRRS